MAGSDGRRRYIYHTAARKRDIGSALVKSALDALQQPGITKVALVVFDRGLPCGTNLPRSVSCGDDAH